MDIILSLYISILFFVLGGCYNIAILSAFLLIILSLSKKREGFEDIDPNENINDTTDYDVDGESTLDARSIDQELIDKVIPMAELDNQDVINELFNNFNDSDGDFSLMNSMKNVATKSKEAMLHRTRFTTDNFRRLYQQELDEEEHKIWWENDALDNKLVKDDQSWLNF